MRLIDADGSYTLNASDNTDYSLCFGGGIISCIDERGHIVAEFFADDAPSIAPESLDAFKELKEDFVDYVCSGVQNPYPYCKNKQPDCDDGRGWCSYRHCNGFNPTTYRAKVDERPQDIDS